MPADITELRGHVDLMRHARAKKAEWTEVEKAAKAAIDEGLAGDDEGAVDGVVVIKRTRIKSNRLDQKLLKSLHPEVAAECMSVSESTRIDLVDTPAGGDV